MTLLLVFFTWCLLVLCHGERAYASTARIFCWGAACNACLWPLLALLQPQDLAVHVIASLLTLGIGYMLAECGGADRCAQVGICVILLFVEFLVLYDLSFRTDIVYGRYEEVVALLTFAQMAMIRHGLRRTLCDIAARIGHVAIRPRAVCLSGS